MSEPRRAMDCDKFESAMLDELYDELDEVTSAALKRHMAGCARCSAALGGLRATRRLVSLPLVEPPPDLERRILEAATPMPRQVATGWRLARIVSVAGTWAMRPQTAMAALFLVMIGSSVLLLRGKSSRAPASASITVTEEGTPAPVASTLAPAAPEGPALASAAPPPPSPAALAARPDPKGYAAAAPAATSPPMEVARARPVAAAKTPADEEREFESTATRGALGAGGGGAAGPAPAMPSPAAQPAFAAAPPMSVPAGRAVARADEPSRPGFAGPPPSSPASPFDQAVSSFRAGRFEEAFQAFDALASSDSNSDLWAARSLQRGRGCRAAVDRYDRVAQRAAGSAAGWDALFEGARCYASLGNAPLARARLNPLLSVEAYHDRARAELDRLAGSSRAPAAAPAQDPGR